MEVDQSMDSDDRVQYLYDTKGNKTAVLVPIDIWNTKYHNKANDQCTPSFDPTIYRGLLKNMGVNGREIERDMRNEWEG